jgi:Phage integrase, N-terminal SAM-like domain
VRATDVAHSPVRVVDDLPSITNDDPTRTLDVDREPYIPECAVRIRSRAQPPAAPSGPSRSPTTLAATEIRLRLHVRPFFGDRPIEAIQPMMIRQGQNQLPGKLGYERTPASRPG